MSENALGWADELWTACLVCRKTRQLWEQCRPRRRATRWPTRGAAAYLGRGSRGGPVRRSVWRCCDCPIR